MLALIATGAFAIATPLLLEWAINSALGAEGAASVDVNKTLVLVAAAALLGAALLRGLAQFLQAYLAEWVGQTVAYDVRNSLYERLQNLSFSYHDEAETGQIMARATQDVEVIRMFLNFGGVRLLFTMMLMSSILVIMLIKDWQLALAVWGFMLVIGWRSFRVSSGLRPVWQDVQEGQAQLGIVLQEALTGIRVVKAFAREPFEGAKFSRAATFLWERSFLASKIQAINMPLMTALWMGSLVATMWIGGVKVANGSMNVGELTSFLFFVQLLQMPIRSLGWMVMMVPRAATSSQRIFDILDEESEVLERPGAHAPRNPRGHVRFSGVAFAYNEERPVLSEVEFEAKPGEVVALLGPTGSGKTTIVNLIPRFYDVTAGAVLLDGEDVRDLTLEGLRSQVAIVQQDVFLFAATIRDNIAYGRPDATDEEVQAAAQLARIHDHISTLPEGYNTWVGERGATLSGGQKQRMAIARALLMDPRVLIFDDSTSSVDSATEYEIQQAMSALMEGRTTFVIAHRLRSVKDADQILVLDESRIVQRGTHLELLAEGGLYREIYDLELRDQEEAFAQVAGGGS
ncbi:MAG: ABC transporter ATP-binding protein [Chloroflexi bacterium]|nr:ABC transporter ATP-binding protein [Chloroflexota bacterium]